MSNHPCGPFPSFTNVSGIDSGGSGPSVIATRRNATSSLIDSPPASDGAAGTQLASIFTSARTPNTLSSARFSTTPRAASMSWKFPLFSTAPDSSEMLLPSGGGFFFEIDDFESVVRVSAPPSPATFPPLPVTSVSVLPMTPSRFARSAASFALAPV